MVGRTVTHYRIVEQLGAGGMGVVYRAEDLRLGRAVALKFLPPELSRDSSAAERFNREARTASSLNHPSICTIYGIDEFEGQRFIAMELLDGQPLSAAIAGRPMPLDRVLELGIQIADALDAAHGQGILHRDIKPANIFITRRGQAKVLDFGLAKLAATPLGFDNTSDDSPTVAGILLSTQGVALGTVAYMSPEQARGEILDARSDLFSFGIVLYEMATGHQAFPGQTSAIVFDSILNRMPPPMLAMRPEIPPQLEQIIMKALEKDRGLRYQTASDLHADLKRLKRDRDSGRAPVSGAVPVASGPVAVPVPVSGPQPVSAGQAAAPRVPLWRSRWALPVAAGLGLVIVAGIAIVPLVGGGSYSWSQWVQGNDSVSASVEKQTPTAPPGDPDSAPVDDPDPELTTGQAGPAANPIAEQQPAAVADANLAAPAVPPQQQAGVTALTPGATTARSKTKPPPSKKALLPSEPPPAPVVAESILPMLPAASPIKADPGATLLSVAQAKADARLYDQAVADFETLVRDHPNSASAPAALMALAGIRAKQSRPDDAMAVYVEVRSRYKGSGAAPEAGIRYAELLLRTRRPDRIRVARETYAAVARNYPDSAWAPRALNAKADLESREKLKEADATLGATVPAALLTWHTLAERYPQAKEAQGALWNLANGYEDIRRYDYAAQTFVALATRFPQTNYDAWWKAAELYDKRLKDKDAAKNAYAKVPQKSRNYQEAQRRAR